MKAIFFGTPQFAIPPLRALIASNFIKAIVVITQPDKPFGRKRNIKPPAVKIEAKKLGLDVSQPLNLKDISFLKILKKLNPSVIVVVAYGKILPTEIIRMPHFGCINIHASLLPKYRGAAPIHWALIKGEKTTGVTSMLMDEGLDTGPILLQKEIHINDDDTVGSLSERLSQIGGEILPPTLTGLFQGTLKPKPQCGDATYAPCLKKNDGLILWSAPAESIVNRIRGLTPSPGVYSFINGERLRILKAKTMEGQGDSGVIMEISKDKLIVGTGKGLLSIIAVQPASKSPMTIHSFIQGRKLVKGMRFSKSGQ